MRVHIVVQALHDLKKKEKRKHVNLLLDTEGDENDRGRGR